MKIKSKLLIILLIGCFFFLRLYKIEERVNFSMDQGISLLRSLEIYQNKELTLLGPTASPVVNGHQFFHGPLGYYSLVALMVISKWNLIVSSYYLVFFNFLALIFLYLAAKKIFNKKIAIITSLSFVFLPISINFSNFLWNPNFLLILTPVFIFLGSKSINNKNNWCFLIWGILGGICLQYHFQFALILFLTLLFLIFKKQIWKNIFLFIVGMMMGYSPLLIFDLRNNFYNVKTIWEWIRYGNDQNFGAQIYYFLSFVPFFCLGLAWIIGKLKNKLILILLLISLISYSFYVKISQNKAFGMPDGWNYPLQKQVVKKILENGCPKDFNVASTISGDTRAYDLRFLLKIKNCEPMGVEEYPKAEKLFLVASINRPPEKEKVWEVSSFGEFKINRQENVTPNIIFYELEKR